MPVPAKKTLEAINASKGGIFSQISDAIGENLPGLDDVQARIGSSLNRASNLGTSIQPTFAPAQIDPGLVPSIDKSVFDFSKLADSIIEQTGLKDLIGELKSAKTTETKKSTTETKKTASDSTPTQGTNKPVEKAKQSREEGRTNLEQLFLDLINGKLDIKL